MAESRLDYAKAGDDFARLTRAEKRAYYLEREAERGRRLGESLGRSIRCSGGYPSDWPIRHAGEIGGCRNDGTGCVCECHDPEEPADA